MIRGVTIGITREITGRTQCWRSRDFPGLTIRTIFASEVPIFGDDFAISSSGGSSVGDRDLGALAYSFWQLDFGVGGNLQAARNVGVPISRVKIFLFMCTAVAAWMVATIQVIGSPAPTCFGEPIASSTPSSPRSSVGCC